MYEYVEPDGGSDNARCVPVGRVVYGPSPSLSVLAQGLYPEAALPVDFWARVAREVAKLIVEKTKV